MDSRPLERFGLLDELSEEVGVAYLTLGEHVLQALLNVLLILVALEEGHLSFQK